MSRQLDIHLFLRSECEHNLTWSRDRGIHFIVRLADSGHLGAVWCLVSGIWVWCLVSGVRCPSLAGAMVWAGDGCVSCEPCGGQPGTEEVEEVEEVEVRQRRARTSGVMSLVAMTGR